MFTGLIEETGVVEAIEQSGQHGQVTIRCEHVIEDARIGDSIAVNGVCLTVTAVNEKRFTADIMAETFASTTLSRLGNKAHVNLERPLAATDRFGGHMVAGHVDGVGEIIRRTEMQESVNFEIKAPEELLRYIVQKGSVAVDGISLTVAHEYPQSFIIAIIPHTLEATNLDGKFTGDKVNIETDIIGKYVEKMLQPNAQPEQAGSSLNELLEENGFYPR
ncbi:riboflavin synthase [Natribacillus halophilus]|uniref:Riboflavin synthase n=1 Tax=Natribacillus halophilus TaxID=549003 RepID=A0A1G8KQ68_9BACI|nr:riboflavin synthase [Natribacillus halophilus]SDI45615.1 riboflavin synthase alpha chain [Natribacillus halophilus]